MPNPFSTSRTKEKEINYFDSLKKLAAPRYAQSTHKPATAVSVSISTPSRRHRIGGWPLGEALLTVPTRRKR